MKIFNKFSSIREQIISSAISLYYKTVIFIKDINYKSKDLTNTNYELGLFHLNKGNIPDAKLRLNIVKMLSSNYKQVDYHLARCFQYSMKIDKAIEIFSKINDENAKYRLNFLKKEKIEKIPTEVLKEDFNSFAAEYRDFCNDINYQAPELICEYLAEYLNESSHKENSYRVLDLGCGIGLTGLALKKKISHINYLVGLDISEKMIEICNDNNLNNDSPIYDKLRTEDFYEYVKTSREKFDIIIACNSLNYNKDLDIILQSLTKLLNEGGLLVFTIDKGDSKDIVFNHTSGSFNFSKSFITKVIDSLILSTIKIEDIAIHEKSDGFYCILKS